MALLQVCRFRDQSVSLHSGLARFFNKHTFSDLVVVAPDGRKLLCHQIILSACSKPFANMLEKGMSRSTHMTVRQLL